MSHIESGVPIIGEVRGTKVGICVSVTDVVKTMFSYDLFRLGCYSTAKNIKMGIFYSAGSLIPRQRERLMDAVMNDPSFSHVIFFDSDMRFPPDTIERLLAHEVPVVAASYPTRKEPIEPVAFATLTDFTERVYTTPGSEGLEKIAAVGFGCILISRQAYNSISKPRFMIGYSPSNDAHVGEDIYFCTKLAQEGQMPLFLDHDLTKQLRHIGEKEFDNNDCLVAYDLAAEAYAAQNPEPEAPRIIVPD